MYVTKPAHEVERVIMFEVTWSSWQERLKLLLYSVESPLLTPANGFFVGFTFYIFIQLLRTDFCNIVVAYVTALQRRQVHAW